MALEKLDDTLATASAKLIAAVEQYGPHATELVLAVGRTAALRDVVTGFVGLFFLGVAAGLAWLCVRLGLHAAAVSYDKDGPYFFGAAVSGVAALVLGTAGLVAALNNLTNVFAWVGISHPEVYLAAKLLKL